MMKSVIWFCIVLQFVLFTQALPTPEQQTTQNGDNTTSVDLYDSKMNWGNAFPWDILSYLTKPDGPCKSIGPSACEGKNLSLPTMIADEGGKNLPVQETVEVKIAQSSWDSTWTRDALVAGLLTVVQKYDQPYDQKYTEISTVGAGYTGQVNSGSIPQHKNTNEATVQIRNAAGGQLGLLQVQISAKSADDGLCSDLAAIGFTQSALIPVSAAGISAFFGIFSSALVGILGALSATCSSGAIGPPKNGPP